MCRMKSMILLKDSVFCPDYDRHSDMLDALKIKDNKRIPDFVKIEIVPPQDDMSRPVEEWAYEPDQDKFPKWYVREVDEPRCREALKKWAAEHIFTDGDHEVQDGLYYALGRSTVTARDNSTVTARGRSTVTAMDSSTVTALDNATVTAVNSATVAAWGRSTVTALDRATVTAMGRSTVTAWDNATVTAYGSSTVKELHDRAVAIKRESYFTKPVVEIAGEDTLRGMQEEEE